MGKATNPRRGKERRGENEDQTPESLLVPIKESREEGAVGGGVNFEGSEREQTSLSDPCQSNKGGVWGGHRSPKVKSCAGVDDYSFPAHRLEKEGGAENVGGRKS